VARVVLVDTVPPPPGGQISEFPVVDGVIPFPGWDFFEDEEIYDIDAATRTRRAAAALSVPARIPTDEIALHDERRFQVPLTLLMGGMDEEAFHASITQWGRYADEFGAVLDARIVKLGTGHWPQFSAPQKLADAILAEL
jgi:pimeloyl-ACP methyl ester carboxylesterase